MIQFTYMSILFSPLTLKSVTLKNRIAISPMCQYSAKDGFPNDWHLVHLGSRAVGGAGLIIAEACAVVPEGRISPFDMGIWKDEHIEAHLRITKFIEGQGAVPGLQLAHAGRKASCDTPWNGGGYLQNNSEAWQIVGPSAISFKPGAPTPNALTIDEIKNVILAFQSAAGRSLKAGYKIIEIHAAHGYLIHQFLSPLSNQRTDAYGGSFENRVRLLLEVVDAIHAVWPSTLPLFVRISATDWSAGGWDLESSIELVKMLKQKGVDLIDTSTAGNIFDAQIPVAPGYQATFAKSIKKDTSILTGAVGLIHSAQQAEEILQNESADLIFIGRLALRDPYFPLNAAKQLNENVKWPLQYERGKI
jgi:2,4-dienoyl-CoA reductase-like NADH-dependent reductase (Old Yellow Enzyme family)